MLVTGLLVLTVPASIALAWFAAPVWALVGVMVLLLVFVACIGEKTMGLWLGALIDERNMMSLSRCQTLLWTMLVVPALLVAAVHNVRTGQPDPLRIDVPPQLWVLLGISGTALAGSGLTKQEKGREVAPESIRTSAPDGIVPKGLLATNEDPRAASWADMTRNEEVAAYGRLDFGKVQLGYITVIVAFTYGVALFSMVSSTGKIGAFPALDAGMIALLGISNAAYLANKTVSSTPKPA